jgi:SAM-dependent methyltransferase
MASSLVDLVDRAVHRRFNRHVNHLTPKYVYRRSSTILYRLRHRRRPWLNPDAVTYLHRTLRPEWRGIEWGSGRSTLWLAGRTAEVTSIESDRGWYERVAAQAAERRIGSLDLRLVEAVEGDEAVAAAYAEAKPELAPGSLDYALVDGIFRELCAIRATTLLRPGGLLILDNANWWIPHATETPFSATYPATPLAERLIELVGNWELRWMTDGITDTAVWIKPAA